jgi:Tol biopolymer transport system component
VASPGAFPSGQTQSDTRAATPPPSGPFYDSIPPADTILFFGTHSDDPAQADQADDELFAIDPVTRAVGQLTSNDLDDAFPTWSPDHTRIAFSRGDTKSHQIVRRDADGSETPITQIPPTTPSPNAADMNAAWSVQDWIAYVHQPNTGGSSIRIVRPDGRDDHQLDAGPHVMAPAWSTDGETLMFMKSTDGTVYDLVQMRIADPTRTVKPLLATPRMELNPSMSSDGRTVVYLGEFDGAGPRKREVAKFDFFNPEECTRLTFNNAWDGKPVWSRDGSQIAFHRTSGDGFHIWTMDQDGTNQVDLMPDRPGRNTDASWR